MIKLELKLLVRYAGSAMDSPRVEINRLNIGLTELHMTKNPSKRIDDVARTKIPRNDLSQHGLKQNELPVPDQRPLHARPTREPFVEVYCCVKPGKSATGDDNSSRLHAATPNRNATRAIK